MSTITHGAYSPPFDPTPAPADAWPPMTAPTSFAVETPQELCADLVEELYDALDTIPNNTLDDMTRRSPLLALVGHGRNLIAASVGITDDIVADFADASRAAIVKACRAA